MTTKGGGVGVGVGVGTGVGVGVGVGTGVGLAATIVSDGVITGGACTFALVK